MYDELNQSELAIIVKSCVESDEQTILPIIKGCLERDYAFRTLFAHRKVILDYEKVEDEIKHKKD